MNGVHDLIDDLILFRVVFAEISRHPVDKRGPVMMAIDLTNVAIWALMGSDCCRVFLPEKGELGQTLSSLDKVEAYSHSVNK